MPGAGPLPGDIEAGLQMEEAVLPFKAAAAVPRPGFPEEPELDEEDEEEDPELETAGGVN